MTGESHEGGSVRLGFERDIILLKLAQIVPLKALRSGAKESKKYTQILSSVRVIGLVEPPVVTPDPKQSGVYFLLDGLLRIEALKDMGIDEVECLVSTDDEAYTYNKRINRLSAVQEHRMIVRAMDRGVPAEQIAKAPGIGSQHNPAPVPHAGWHLSRSRRDAQGNRLPHDGLRDSPRDGSHPSGRGSRTDDRAEQLLGPICKGAAGGNTREPIG